MKKKMGSLFVLLSAMALVVFPGQTALAVYPEKPITMYCVFSPGGSLDTTSRAVVSGAEKILGQPIVVITKEGGAGTIGLSVLANDKPDGYSLAAFSSGGITRIPLTRKVSYKPLASFTPIFAYATIPCGLLVKADSPFKTFEDFIEYARQNPGKVKYSTAGAGMITHTMMEVIGKKEKINWVHVPFKGDAPSGTAALGGHVDAASLGTMNLALSGQLRPLLIYNSIRYFRFPEIPTAIEKGYRYNGDTFFAFLGPAGMDPAVVKKLEDAFEKALDMPAWKKVADSFGMVTLRMRSAELTKILEKSWDWELDVQKSLGVITSPATAPR